MLLKLESITRDSLLIDFNEKRYRNAISKLEIENPLSYDEFVSVVRVLTKTSTELTRTQVAGYNEREFYSHKIGVSISFAEYLGTILQECSIDDEYQSESISAKLKIISDDGNDIDDDFTFTGGVA